MTIAPMAHINNMENNKGCLLANMIFLQAGVCLTLMEMSSSMSKRLRIKKG
jgi:hypothetical protein